MSTRLSGRFFIRTTNSLHILYAGTYFNHGLTVRTLHIIEVLVSD
ncbi:hypothetical protein RSAG8_04239, partial [Rhizoctonia solani AG-8 WAC10335]